MNKKLGAWFRGGAQERLAALASAEERLKATTQRIVEQPTMDVLAVTTAAADEVQAACIEGLQWLTLNKCPVDRVGYPLREAFTQFRLAAETLIRMRSGDLPMSAESGEIAREAVAKAHGFLYDTTMAFGEEIGK